MNMHKGFFIYAFLLIIHLCDFTHAGKPVMYQPLPKTSPEKLTKAVSREVKTLKKQGWKTAPGCPSMESQLTRFHQMKAELNYDLSEVYLFSVKQCLGRDYNEARTKTKELAILELAGMIETRVIAHISTFQEVGNVNGEDILTKSIIQQASRQFVNQNMRDIILVSEVFRKLSTGEYEVRTCWACKKKSADVFTEEIVNEMKNHTNSRRE